LERTRQALAEIRESLDDELIAAQRAIRDPQAEQAIRQEISAIGDVLTANIPRDARFARKQGRRLRRVKVTYCVLPVQVGIGSEKRWNELIGDDVDAVKLITVPMFARVVTRFGRRRRVDIYGVMPQEALDYAQSEGRSGDVAIPRSQRKWQWRDTDGAAMLIADLETWLRPAIAHHINTSPRPDIGNLQARTEEARRQLGA
jgi:hypothetical protein